MPLLPYQFSSILILLAVTSIVNLTISFDVNNYSVLIFTMVIILFGTTRDLMAFTISSAMISYVISKSFISIT